jgi:hypothetical protein
VHDRADRDSRAQTIACARSATKALVNCNVRQIARRFFIFDWAVTCRKKKRAARLRQPHVFTYRRFHAASFPVAPLLAGAVTPARAKRIACISVS